MNKKTLSIVFWFCSVVAFFNVVFSSIVFLHLTGIVQFIDKRIDSSYITLINSLMVASFASAAAYGINKRLSYSWYIIAGFLPLNFVWAFSKFLLATIGAFGFSFPTHPEIFGELVFGAFLVFVLWKWWLPLNIEFKKNKLEQGSGVEF